MPTMLDIAKANGSDAAVGLIEEAVRLHPELTAVNARTIKGQMFKTLVRTAVPTGSTFRAANQGTDAKNNTYENRLVECFTANPRWECDKAVADKYEDGPEAWIALEAAGIVEGAMQDLCKQFYYGTTADANGYPGLSQVVNSAMVLDAKGSTASTGSSVYLVRTGPQHVQWCLGENGSMEVTDVRVESITDDAGKRYSAYIQELLAYPGLMVGSIYSVVRICNLTNDTDHGLTDDLLYEALTMFPAGNRPDVILTGRRSLEQLRKSRTATNATGAPAPTPTEFENIPLLPTEAISDVEAIVA